MALAQRFPSASNATPVGPCIFLGPNAVKYPPNFPAATSLSPQAIKNFPSGVNFCTRPSVLSVVKRLPALSRARKVGPAKKRLRMRVAAEFPFLKALSTPLGQELSLRIKDLNAAI